MDGANKKREREKEKVKNGMKGGREGRWTKEDGERQRMDGWKEWWGEMEG